MPFPREGDEAGEGIAFGGAFAVTDGDDVVLCSVHQHDLLAEGGHFAVDVHPAQGEKELPPERHVPQNRLFGHVVRIARVPVVGDAERGIEEGEPRKFLGTKLRCQRAHHAALARAEEVNFGAAPDLARIVRGGEQVVPLAQKGHLRGGKAAQILLSAPAKCERKRTRALLLQKFGERRKVLARAAEPVADDDDGKILLRGQAEPRVHRPIVMGDVNAFHAPIIAHFPPARKTYF